MSSSYLFSATYFGNIVACSPCKSIKCTALKCFIIYAHTINLSTILWKNRNIANCNSTCTTLHFYCIYNLFTHEMKRVYIYYSIYNVCYIKCDEHLKLISSFQIKRHCIVATVYNEIRSKKKKKKIALFIINYLNLPKQPKPPRIRANFLRSHLIYTSILVRFALLLFCCCPKTKPRHLLSITKCAESTNETSANKIICPYYG